MRYLNLRLFGCIGLSIAMAAQAYNPNASNIVTSGNFVFELEISSGEKTGFATLIDVKPGYEPAGEITIPGSVTSDGVKYVVDEIGYIYLSDVFFEKDRAFKDFPGITKINIPSTIRAIGNMEFLGCTGINEFHVNANNKNFKDIDGVLFYRWGEDWDWHLFRMPPARPKTKYTLPDDVRGIEACAFADSKTLRTIILSPGCTLNDPLWAWRNHTIREIDVSKSEWYEEHDGIIFNSWGSDNELVACPPALKLDKYSIPSYCTSIGGGAFCSSVIPEVEIHDTVRIGGYAFAGSALREFRCTTEALIIGSLDICLLCKDLKKVHIVSSGHAPVLIDRYCFALCPSLEEVVFDSDNVDIRTGAFYGCSGLKEFPFSQVVSMEGSDADSYWCGRQFQGSGITSVIVPSTFETIPENCFRDCKNLKNVQIDPSGEGLTSYIGIGAFRNCPSLESINLKHLKAIGGHAFVECPLKTIIIPARSEKEGEIRIGLSFDFFSETRLYLDTSAVSYVSAYGSCNNEKGTFIISSLDKKTSAVPNHWNHLYCPAGMADWYLSEEFYHHWGWGGEVTELFSLERSESESSLELCVNPELDGITCLITGVKINGIEAQNISADIWSAGGSFSALDAEVRIDYSVDGVPMSTTYPPYFNTSMKVNTTALREIAEIWTVAGYHAGTTIEGLQPGIYIVRYTDGSAHRMLIKTHP